MFNFFKHAYIIVVSLFFISNNHYQAMYNAHPASSFNDTTGLIAEGATLQLVSKQFRFTEGPAVDKSGNIFFTDQPNDAIWQYSTDGTLKLFQEKTGRANGLYVDKNGNIIACADENNELWRISPEKQVTVLYKAKRGKRLNGPNDLWIDASGGIYITDPYYQRPYWKHKSPERKNQSVYYLPPGRKKLIEVENTLKQPNGIVGSANGKWLFVADIGAGKIYKYEIQKGGSLNNKQLFVDQGADGMTLDNQGNLYLAGNGVAVYNSTGKKIEQIDVPEKWTANLCFGGKDKNILFITASEAVYTLQMAVKGVE